MSHDFADDLLADLEAQEALLGRMSEELERLGRGIEKIRAKYGADDPSLARAIDNLLRNVNTTRADA